MTLEEAIQMANNGNTSAMLAVGDSYFENKDFTEALKYYEMAGEDGSCLGMQKSMLLRCIMARTLRDLHAWDDVVKHCEKMYYWSRYILNIQKTSDAGLFSKEDYDKAYQNALQALYVGGMAYWFQKDFQNALEASVGLENAQLQILHGLSLFYLANSEDELRKVLQELKILETSDWYPNDADHYDDVIFTVAAQTLALLYREGILGKPDLQHAHQALLSVYNVVKSADQKAKLSSELGHYYMSRFGGFTYS